MEFGVCSGEAKSRERWWGDFITRMWLGFVPKVPNEVRRASLQYSSPARGGFKFARPLPHPNVRLIRSS